MNDTFIKHIAREIEKGFEDPENPYLYLKYEHLEDNSPELNKCEIKNIQNRLILDELSLIEGEAYSYINVPCNELGNMERVDKQRYEGADNCKNRIIARQGEEKTLSDIINNIKKCFKDRTLEICEQEHYFKIVTTSPQDLKTIHVIASCNDSKNQRNRYNFNDAEKAMRMCNKIASILCIESKYSEEDIKMINREYLFKPHKPESFQTEDKKPLFNKRVLVIGTSHYCPHDSCNDYVYCTNNATSSGYSKIHKENTGCKQGFPLEKATQNLITSFIGESLNDKEQDRDYTSLSIFSNFMIEYFKKKGEDVSSKDFWEHVAFVNYAQNFESRKETTYFSPNDFEAFKKYLDEIKPDVVIVWGSELGEELRKNLKVQPSEQNETNGNSILYYWKGTGEYEKIEFLNCHHPYNNSEKFMSDENFSNALNKIFNPKGDAGEPHS